MVLEWLEKLGLKGLKEVVRNEVREVLKDELKPLESNISGLRDRVTAVETGIQSQFSGLRDKLDAIENRLDVAGDIAKMKVEIAELKARS